MSSKAVNSPAYFAVLFALLLSLVFLQAEGFADQTDCVGCHEPLAKEKVVHPALQMGCTSCHTAVDASDVPHKFKNKIAKGLSAEQPELCFGCHDNMRLKKKVVHAAVSMGCTGCHNPHSSKNAKLLKADLPELCYGCHDKQKFTGKSVHAPVGIGMCMSCHSPHQSDNSRLLTGEPPELCYSCHDKATFSKKVVHAPVAGGMCLSCHSPHAAEEFALLNKDAANLCLECHPDVRKRPHAITGLGSFGHPIGLTKKGKTQQDPARPGKRFYCGSCHDPHSSDNRLLFRYDAASSMALCMHCHNK